MLISFNKAEVASMEEASSGFSSDIYTVTFPLPSLSSLLAQPSEPIILSCWQILWKISRRLPCWMIGRKSSWNWSEPLSVERSELAVLRIKVLLPASKELSLLLLYVSFIKVVNVSSKVPSGAFLLSANTSASVMVNAAR